MNPIIVKAVIVLFIFTIFISLGSALYYLVQDKGESQRTIRALTWRIGLSFLLFVLLLIAFALGWIQPHGA